VYRALVRHQIAGAFTQLSAGDWDALLHRIAPDVQHTFAGTSALGGSRHGLVAVRAWSERLQRLLPGLVFDVHVIAVDGGPLDTHVGIEWTSTAALPDGSTYVNDGAHVVRLSRGRITSFHAYLHDTAVLDRALDVIAASGQAEAHQPPLA